MWRGDTEHTQVNPPPGSSLEAVALSRLYIENQPRGFCVESAECVRKAGYLRIRPTPMHLNA